MNAARALKLVQESLADQFDLELDKLGPDSHLFKDLGLDSIDALDLVGVLEKRLGAPVPEDELKAIRTVRDVAELIVRNAPLEASA